MRNMQYILVGTEQQTCQKVPKSQDCTVAYLDHEFLREVVDLSPRARSPRQTLLPMELLQASFVGVCEDLAKAASSAPDTDYRCVRVQVYTYVYTRSQIQPR